MNQFCSRVFYTALFLAVLTSAFLSRAISFAADTTPVRILSYEEAAEIALRDNTDILQLRATEEASKFQETQAISPNEPLFSLTNNNSASPFRLAGGASKNYQLQWTLGFPGKAIFTSKSFADLALSAREQGFQKEVSILVSLSNLYIQISTNTELQKILSRETERTSEILKITERKYGLGQATQVDILSSKAAIAKLRHDLLAATENAKVLQTQFLTILRKPDANYAATPNIKIENPEVTISQEDLIQVMLRNNHQVKANDFTVSSASATTTNAAMAWLPDVQLTAGMNLYTIPGAQANPDLSRDYTFGVQIVLPIFYAVNERSVYRTARANQSASEFQADSSRLQLISSLKSDYTLYQAGYNTLKDTQSFVLPSMKAAYELTSMSYGLGKANYLDLAAARSGWISTTQDELQKRNDLAMLFNALTLDVGCDFRHKEGPHVCR